MLFFVLKRRFGPRHPCTSLPHGDLMPLVNDIRHPTLATTDRQAQLSNMPAASRRPPGIKNGDRAQLFSVSHSLLQRSPIVASISSRSRCLPRRRKQPRTPPSTSKQLLTTPAKTSKAATSLSLSPRYRQDTFVAHASLDPCSPSALPLDAVLQASHSQLRS